MRLVIAVYLRLQSGNVALQQEVGRLPIKDGWLLDGLSSDKNKLEYIIHLVMWCIKHDFGSEKQEHIRFWWHMLQ